MERSTILAHCSNFFLFSFRSLATSPKNRRKLEELYLLFKPCQDFVYQAAWRDGGPKAEGHIFRGILRTLARALAPPPAGAHLPAQQPVLVVFTEVADTEVNSDLTSPSRKRRLGRREEINSGRRSSDEDDDLRESPMDDESVGVKR